MSKLRGVAVKMGRTLGKYQVEAEDLPSLLSTHQIMQVYDVCGIGKNDVTGIVRGGAQYIFTGRSALVTPIYNTIKGLYFM